MGRRIYIIPQPSRAWMPEPLRPGLRAGKANRLLYWIAGPTPSVLLGSVKPKLKCPLWRDMARRLPAIIQNPPPVERATRRGPEFALYRMEFASGGGLSPYGNVCDPLAKKLIAAAKHARQARKMVANNGVGRPSCHWALTGQFYAQTTTRAASHDAAASGWLTRPIPSP